MHAFVDFMRYKKDAEGIHSVGNSLQSLLVVDVMVDLPAQHESAELRKREMHLSLAATKADEIDEPMTVSGSRIR